MTANLAAFRGLLDGITAEEAAWKSAPDKWSVLELTNHLYEEEYLDFRIRVELTLSSPGKEWPGWDPVGAVEKGKYNQRDFEKSKQNLFDERQKSISWLKGLENPDWDKYFSHSRLGDLRAGDLLAAWLAHDYLHIRQLANIHLLYTKNFTKPFDTRYAAL